MANVARRRAAQDPRLAATVVSRRALFYDAGADPTLDRPAHVRAGSGLAWFSSVDGPRLVVAQDDASFLAIVDPASGRVEALALDHVVEGARQFDARRGNKMHKLDLEACCTLRLDGREVMLVFGSGSAPARERIVVLEPDRGARIVDATPLFGALRARTDFSGSELNVEGAAAVGPVVRLFQRGNGAVRGPLRPLDATGDLDARALLAFLDDPGRAPPPLENVVQWELGSIEGVRLTFTDACARGDGVAFLAAAEASADVIEDGEVVGTALGWMDADGARWAAIREADGRPLLDKAEGLAFAPNGRALVVVDCDDPDVPAVVCEVTLTGFP